MRTTFGPRADAVLLVAETMPPACAHLTRARERAGLIVVDPRRTATAALAADDGSTPRAPTRSARASTWPLRSVCPDGPSPGTHTGRARGP